MKTKQYRREEVSGLQHLLASIGREMEERNAALAVIDLELETLDQDTARDATSSDADARRNLQAEAALHKRNLRLAHAELERLGCSILGTMPLTFRIPGRVGEANRSFVWQTGDPVLK